MERLKVMTILGTRPEIIRLSEVMKCCDRHFDHIMVHTGQNYDYQLNQVFFEELGIRRPDYCLDCAGRHVGETIGNIISRTFDVLEKERPDAVLLLGDTNSALAAVSAKRLKIPIFHMEAGNRCWDFNVPEMINRKIVDHISDINLPYTEHSRKYLLSEGIDGKTIFVTGSPMPEVLSKYREKIDKSDVLERLCLKERGYFLLSAHREENIDQEDSFFSLMDAVNGLAEQYGLPVIYSVHPRSRKAIEKRQYKFHPSVRLSEPFGFWDYNKLQKNACCVLSDSGTLSEESAMNHFPAVLIRTSTERPEALDGGTVIVGGITEKTILQAVKLAVEMDESKEQGTPDASYEVQNVSVKVVKLIQSYTDVVNRTVWQKNTKRKGDRYL